MIAFSYKWCRTRYSIQAVQRQCKEVVFLKSLFLQIWLPSGAEKAVTMAVRYNSRLMFALFLLIHRSHNTVGDGRTREWLFEGANSPLDKKHCKTLSISCDRLLRACDCSLLLSVVGSKWRIHLLSTLICLLCEVSSACSCHGGSDTSEVPWMVFASLEVLLFKNCFEWGISPHHVTGHWTQELRSTDRIITDQTLLLLGPPREAVTKKNLNWVRSAVNRPSAGVNLPYFYRPKSKTTNTIMKTERTIWQRHAETLWTCPLCRRRLPPHRDTVHKWADANWTSHLGGQKVPYTIKRSTFKTFQTFFFFFSQNYAHHCILELEI